MVKLETHQSNALEQKRRKIRRVILSVFGSAILVALFMGYRLYTTVLSPNVITPDNKDVSLYIPTGADFNTVKDSLYTKKLIISPQRFEWLAKKKNYPENIKAGHYVLKNGMTNNNLVNMLRGGFQKPVRVTFNNIRDVNMLAGRISKQIEADSTSIIALLHDDDFLRQIGFNQQSIPALFLPNTYEFYWNTDAEAFTSRMLQEYRKFWNEERTEKAKALNLTPIEISILASIVNKETNMSDEMPKMAGVYLNRLRNGWLLQADPTLVFAIGDFNIKRVLDVHKEIESPYNTYKYAGLPPGPICSPSITSIDAVLNAEKHQYYYFCAKEDMSGYHNFAKTLAEHLRNANKYQQALNNLRIWK
jgi:conserved hypothetical protein, YceG family